MRLRRLRVGAERRLVAPLRARRFAAPLHAIGASDLTISGPGTLDGGGDRGDWWTWPKETRQGARRPRGLHLIDCTDTTLLGFTIRNAPSWTIHPQGCHRLTAAALRIEAPHDSPNTDGFNPEMCEDVEITGTHFSVGDDCIAIKSGKRGPNGESSHLRPTTGIRELGISCDPASDFLSALPNRMSQLLVHFAHQKHFQNLREHFSLVLFFPWLLQLSTPRP